MASHGSRLSKADTRPVSMDPARATAVLWIVPTAACRALRPDLLSFTGTASREPMTRSTILAGGAYRAARLELEQRARDARGPLQPACRAGCAFCCRGKVVVTWPDAEGLADWLRAQPPTVRDDVLARARRNLGAEATGKPHREPCPLLADDGRCRAYERRPALCRVHWSSSVERCELLDRTGTLNGDHMAQYRREQDTYLGGLQALARRTRGHGLLATMLLKALREI